MTYRFKPVSHRVLVATVLTLSAAVLSPGAFAVSTTASATAVVIQPIAVTKAADLSFGHVAPGNGTVTLTTAGAVSTSGSVAPTIGSTKTAAEFDVTGEPSNTFTIDLATGTSTVLTDLASNTMAITFVSEVVSGNGAASGTANNSATGTLSVGGAARIYVGGALTVGANQTPGTYTGTLQVTVAYN